MVRRSGWRSDGPAFFRSFPVRQTCLLLCVRRPEIEHENGGTRGISCRRDRSGSFFRKVTSQFGQNQNRDRQLSALARGLGSRCVGLGPRCGLRAAAWVRTRRSPALAGAARSRIAHHNSDLTVATIRPLDFGSELWLLKVHRESGASNRGERRRFGTNSARVCVLYEWR